MEQEKIKLSTRKSPMECFLMVLIAVQLLVLCYINLFTLKHYIGFDISSYYLQTMVIWEQGTFLISDWDYPSTLCWDTPLLFAVPLYGLTGDIFLAYGIGNLISVAFLLAVATRFTLFFHSKPVAQLLFIALLLTPYMAYTNDINRIDYFGCLFSMLGAYAIKFPILLLVWTLFLELDGKKWGQISLKTRILLLFSLMLSFFTGLSSGFFALIFGVVPAFCAYFLRSVWKNRWNVYGVVAPVFLLVSATVTILGKTVAVGVLGFVGKDSGASWVTIPQFWDNLLSIFQGYLQLTGALPHFNNISVFQQEGTFFFPFLLLSMGILLSSLLAMKKWANFETKSTLGLSVYFFLANLLIFVLLYTRYGDPIFESRYLIPAFCLMLAFASSWITEELSSDNRSWRILLTALLCFALIFVNGISYYQFYHSQNDMEIREKIIEVVAEYDYPVVFYNDAVSNYGVIPRDLRVLDRSKVYKYVQDMETAIHASDYNTYDDIGEYEGGTLLITYSNLFWNLPEYIRIHYALAYQFPDSYLCLYYSYENPADFVAGITEKPYNKDMPYTKGIQLSEQGSLNPVDGSFTTDGTGGFVTGGPFTPVVRGNYDFVLNYEIVNENSLEFTEVGVFYVKIGDENIAEMSLDSQSRQAVLSGVDLVPQGDDLLEYPVFVENGVEIRVESFEIYRN